MSDKGERNYAGPMGGVKEIQLLPMGGRGGWVVKFTASYFAKSLPPPPLS